MKKFAFLLSLVLAAALCCSACGEEEHRHEYSETWQRIVEPTCRQEGKEIRTCKYCEETLERPIPKLEHDLSLWTADETGHWRECSMCHTKFSDDGKTEGTGEHSYLGSGNICTVCGFDKSGSTGLVFRLSSDKSHYILSKATDLAAESIVVPETYCSIIVGEIAADAFSGCERVKSISLPSRLTRLGGDVFADCNALERITVPDTNPAFRTRDGILYNAAMTEYVHVPAKVAGEINVPDSIRSLGGAIFAGRAISKITLPQGLVSIGEKAFSGCDRLQALEVPSTVTEIGKSAFEGCDSLGKLTLPLMHTDEVSEPDLVNNGDGTMNYVGNSYLGYLFGATVYIHLDSVFPSALKEVEFTGGDTLDPYCFYRCTGLTRVVLPETLRTIKKGAFEGCTGLESVTLPSRLTTVGENAFSGCSSLQRLHFPASLTLFGADAVRGCSSLEAIDVDAGNEQFTSQDGILYRGNFTGILVIPAALKGDITIPETITALGANSFKGRQITSVRLPATLNMLGEMCFADCASLRTVTIPRDCVLTRIEDYCFSGCALLGEIVIPAQVKNIGLCAFEGCDALARAEFLSPEGWQVESIGGNQLTVYGLSDPASAARQLRETYVAYTWTHN